MKKTIVLLLMFVFAVGISVNAQSKTKKQWAQYNKYAVANKSLKKLPDVVFMGNSITENWASMMPEFFANNNYVGRGLVGKQLSKCWLVFVKM